jgi:SP family myo-inositol transporter-like MFS transporter 13
MFITLGQVVAYLTGYVLSEHVNGWRWMVGLGAVPAGIQFVVLVFMPETPRWLVKVDRKKEARHVLDKVFGKALHAQRMVDGVLRAVENEIAEEDRAQRLSIGTRESSTERMPFLSRVKGSWSQLFLVGGHRRALTIACLLQGLQQLCGFVSDANS